MPKVLLLGYDYADDIAALSIGAADLCDALCRNKFAIGLENLPFNTDLDEQLDDFNKRIHQIKTLAQGAFHVSWEQLIQEYNPSSLVLSEKAIKPLIPRAKTLHFQQAILNTLQHYPATPFFGLNNELNTSNLLNCLSQNEIKWTALFNSKDNILKMKNDLKSSKVSVEATFLFSAHYPPSEETEKELKQADITSTNITKFCIPSSISSFIQQICTSLDQKGRLSISMSALSKRQASKQRIRNISLPDRESEFSRDVSVRGEMKGAAKEFRGIFNGADSGASTPTIVRNRQYQDEDE